MLHLRPETIERAFVEAFNRVLADRDRYIREYDEIVRMLTNTDALDKEAAKLQDEVVEVYELIRRSINENARIAQDQEEYSQQAEKLDERYASAKKRLDTIAEEQQERAVRREKIGRFLADLQRQEGLLTEFDEGLWRATVESLTVSTENDVLITFKDGSEIPVDVSEK